MKAVIEFEFEENIPKEFAEDYVEAIRKMLYMFHFVDGVTKFGVVEQDEEREFVVTYTATHSKLIKAKTRDEAERKVMDYREGESLTYDKDLVAINERQA